MEDPIASAAEQSQLRQRVRIGLIRELYRQHHITRTQFEQLMRLQRGR